MLGDYMKAQAEYKPCNRTISSLKTFGPTHFDGGKDSVLFTAWPWSSLEPGGSSLEKNLHYYMHACPSHCTHSHWVTTEQKQLWGLETHSCYKENQLKVNILLMMNDILSSLNDNDP